MPLVSMTEMLQKAKAGKYAVGQFNMNNLEFTQAIIEAAVEENSPVILGVSEGAARYMGLEYTVAMAKAAAETANIPIALHLDHGSSFEVAMKFIRAGFSSVMFDGSHHPFEENITLTKKVVEAAHAMGVSVEGELGTIGGVEDDLSVEEEDAKLAKPEEAIEFYKQTGVDALAIAVGSAHGMYKGVPKIHHDIIEAVSKQIDIPLVLHGGSGIPDEDITKAIAAGIGKINVNTENQVALTNTIREIFAKDAKVYDPRKYLGPGREAMKEVVRGKIRLFGSNGKA
ncbi:class II fructose-1,6-bisphosphate aldolase [Tepidibacillus infernus]|uniref:Tagatose-bisphosphate aldolase n=1 Tax=Tepidibacillus decaturensis TaxID=1413211 RepID=A0A135L6S7_9BACI|nr:MULTISPECIES: class II fructose-1,6-bisphosphate aldolase [Tepidibacillus]KXG44676.1 tagatose-bisphosphate aldolase [Tepidibacillus decaturensis]GBF12531.1 putative fructose-bisphosphate aldolase [Tepidibacillus sp. HK-1]